MWNKNSQAGFTLVETMVSMALVATIITLGMNFLSTTQKTRDQRSKQTIHRYIAIQVTQHVTGNLGFYPPVDPLNPSDKIVYVGCMNKDGVLIGNKGFRFHLATAFDEATSTGICPTDKTHYEARFFWLNPLQDEVKINLLTLATGPGTTASLAVHNFKIFAK